MAKHPKTGTGTVRLALCMVASWDTEYIKYVLNALSEIQERYVYISKRGWDGLPSDYEATVRIVQEAKATPIVLDVDNESDHRKAALAHVATRSEYALIIDSDELATKLLIKNLKSIASARSADIVRCRLATYFLSPTLRVRPDEPIAPIVMVNTKVARHVHIREYEAPGNRHMMLEAGCGVLAHLSWCGSPVRLDRKLSSSSHRPEFVPNYKAKVIEGFKQNMLLRALHPTNPANFGWAERVPLDEVLKGVPDLYPCPPEPDRPDNWPSFSVVIPSYGGPDELKLNLEALYRCGIAGRHECPLIDEVIVVDDASPDDAARAAESFDFVKLLRNERNLGFAKTSNRGMRETRGDVIMLLNSDCIVTRSALIRLGETLMSSHSIGIAGPYTNHAAYGQAVPSTYTDLANLDLFCRDFAARPQEDEDRSMLVGFAWALKRSTLEEVGYLSEEYDRALYEDTDYVQRIQARGLRAVLSGRSFVHHFGSLSLARMDTLPRIYLNRNEKIFRAKFAKQVEMGFASHLAGDRTEPIRFDRTREPARVIRETHKLMLQANASLAVILKNEAKNVENMLNSTAPFFKEIVVYDTGSTDGTQDIARRCGARVIQGTWEKSFAQARNESFKYITTDWGVWTDGDDLWPFVTGEKILHAIINCPPNVGGLGAGIQFCDEGPNAGTRVDHIKAIRMRLGQQGMAPQWEGRIHEQILPSIRRAGMDVMMLDAIILHAAYDTSVEGQMRKAIRDEELLWLSIQDDPTHPFNYFNFGMTRHHLGQHNIALRWLERCLRMSHPTDSHVRKAYALKGCSQHILGRLDAAMATFYKGLDAVGEDPELRFRMAMTLSALGDLRGAKAEYLKVSNEIPKFFSSIDIGILSFKRFHNLGTLCEELGEHQEALAWWQKAMEANPAFVPAAEMIFRTSMDRRDFGNAERACDAVVMGAGPLPMWAEMRAAVADAQGQNPDELLARLWHERPNALATGELLSKRLLQRGDMQNALPLLGQLEQWGSAEAAFNLSIFHLQRCEYQDSMRHLKIALEFRPDWDMAVAQLERLEKFIAVEEASDAGR